jgi:hypothetical protein
MRKLILFCPMHHQVDITVDFLKPYVVSHVRGENLNPIPQTCQFYQIQMHFTSSIVMKFDTYLVEGSSYPLTFSTVIYFCKYTLIIYF